MYILTGNFRLTPVRKWFKTFYLLEVEVQRYVTQGFTGHSLPDAHEIGEPYWKTADGHDAVELKAHIERQRQDYQVVMRAKTQAVMLSELQTKYEEFRKLLDGGSDSMTHDDALNELERMVNLERDRASLT